MVVVEEALSDHKSKAKLGSKAFHYQIVVVPTRGGSSVLKGAFTMEEVALHVEKDDGWWCFKLLAVAKME